MFESIINRDFSKEFKFTASRSGGPGGQNVNKVSSKIELRFNINESTILTAEEKDIIIAKLATRINNEGELVIVSQSERSQLANKEKAIEKFYNLVSKALKPVKKRKLTKPTKASQVKRLDSKKVNSERKQRRKQISFE